MWEKEGIAYFVECDPYRDIARESIVFEWRIYSGHTTGQLFDDVPEMMNAVKNASVQFRDRLTFMPMYHDIDWDQKRNESVCKQNSAYLPLPT